MLTHSIFLSNRRNKFACSTNSICKTALPFYKNRKEQNTVEEENKIIEETEEKIETVAEDEPVVPAVTEDGADVADEDTGDEPKYNDEPPAGRELGHLTLIYDEYDIFDVMKIQERSRLSLRIMTTAMIVLPILGIGMSVYNLIKNPEGSPATLILWTAVLLFVFYSYVIAPKRNAKRTFMGIDADQKAGNVSSFTVYEGGIYAESKYGKQTFLWNEFREAYECPAGIVIVTNSKGPVFFPERLLEDFDRTRFSEVLEENYGKKYFVSSYISERKKYEK